MAPQDGADGLLAGLRSRRAALLAAQRYAA